MIKQLAVIKNKKENETGKMVDNTLMTDAEKRGKGKSANRSPAKN